jgi:hypothetical protein
MTHSADKYSSAMKSLIDNWTNQSLDRSTYDEFRRDLFVVAGDMLEEYFSHGALGLVMSEEQWRALPGHDLGNGNFEPFPEIPAIPAEPDLPADNAAADRAYNHRVARNKLTMAKRRAMIDAAKELKDMLRNIAVVGDNRPYIIGSADLVEQLNDTPRAMAGRLEKHLGTPDLETFEQWAAVYNSPAHTLDVREWLRRDKLANERLTNHGRQLNNTQRLTAFKECYRHSSAVQTCLKDFAKDRPALAQQTFDLTMAYVVEQEPNIRVAMSKSDVGYAARDTSIPSNAEEPRIFTQTQFDRAVAFAVKEAQGKATSGQLYCWLHSYNATHSGTSCRNIEDGKPILHFRDSRDYQGEGRVFGHVNCQHSPKCIGVEDAKSATAPNSFPDRPGNKVRHGNNRRKN